MPLWRLTGKDAYRLAEQAARAGRRDHPANTRIGGAMCIAPRTPASALLCAVPPQGRGYCRIAAYSRALIMIFFPKRLTIYTTNDIITNGDYTADRESFCFVR